MTTTQLAIYDPPIKGMPRLAIVIRNGDVLACEAVQSTAEGEFLLAKIRENLAEFVEEAKRPQV
jgi:hypothetical protein